MSTVAVVIPHWNKRELLGPLLERLGRQTHPIEEILVVDNGSGDGSAEYARQLGARVLALPKNVGFARAVNLGVAEVSTDYVVILNNDVSPESGWLAALSGAMDEAGEQSWFACGKLLAGAGGVLDGTFDLVSRGACAWRAGHGRRDGPVWDRPRRIRSAPFTAALFRKELFAHVGPLEEAFESYLEDVEFGLRCAGGGYGGIYVPSAIATHQGSATLGRWHPRTVKNISRNQLLLAAKYYPPRWLKRYVSSRAVKTCSTR